MTLQQKTLTPYSDDGTAIETPSESNQSTHELNPHHNLTTKPNQRNGEPNTTNSTTTNTQSANTSQQKTYTAAISFASHNTSKLKRGHQFQIESF